MNEGTRGIQITQDGKRLWCIFIIDARPCYNGFVNAPFSELVSTALGLWVFNWLAKGETPEFAEKIGEQFYRTGAIHTMIRAGKAATSGFDEISFDSMANCSAITGIPIQIIKAAKNANHPNQCDAFYHGRVQLAPLIRWIFSNKDESDESGELIDWKKYGEKFSALREEIKYENDSKESISRSEVADKLRKGMAALHAAWDRKIKLELPPDLKGRDELEIAKKLELESDQCWDLLKSELLSLTETKTKIKKGKKKKK